MQYFIKPITGDEIPSEASARNRSPHINVASKASKRRDKHLLVPRASRGGFIDIFKTFDSALKPFLTVCADGQWS